MYRYHNSDFFFPRLGFSSRMLGFRDPFEDFFTTPLLHNDIDTALSDLWTDFGVLTPHARHRNIASVTPAHLTNQNAANNSNTKPDAEQDPTAKEESHQQQQLEHKGLEQKGDISQLNLDQQQKQEKQQQQQQQQAMVHHTGSDWLQSYLRAPNVEVIAKENEFLVNVDVPGVRKEDVKVNITEDARGRKMLNISGERRDQTSQEDKERGYTVTTTSRMYGKFSRSLLLPDGASMEGVKAKQENGVLSVSVPRVAVKPKMSAMDIDVQ